MQFYQSRVIQMQSQHSKGYKINSNSYDSKHWLAWQPSTDILVCEDSTQILLVINRMKMKSSSRPSAVTHLFICFFSCQPVGSLSPPEAEKHPLLDSLSGGLLSFGKCMPCRFKGMLFTIWAKPKVSGYSRNQTSMLFSETRRALSLTWALMKQPAKMRN